MPLLTEYEKRQLRSIRAWKEKDRNFATKVFDLVGVPFTWVAKKIIPETAIGYAIKTASSAGSWLADKNDIIRRSGVSDINDLRKKSLKLSDTLAHKVCRRAVKMAVTEGAVTGLGGPVTMVIDIPIVVTLALRTIHKVGLCYGYEATNDYEEQFIFGVLSCASCNSIEEKTGALIALSSVKKSIEQLTLDTLAAKAAQGRFSREGLIMATRKLAHQLGMNISRRKVLQTIPAVGAVMGGAANGLYIKDVGVAARRSFQERWLVDKQETVCLCNE